MTLVLDASMAIAWLFDDESSEAADAAMEHVADFGAVVPSLWRLEVANVLTISMRRGRCDADFVDRSLTRFGELAIEVDDATSFHAWNQTLRLAWDHGLTIYDASYLELALRRGLPLASCDKALNKAALRNRVELIAT